MRYVTDVGIVMGAVHFAHGLRASDEGAPHGDVPRPASAGGAVFTNAHRSASEPSALSDLFDLGDGDLVAAITIFPGGGGYAASFSRSRTVRPPL
jgi:hypothetical protein